MSILSEVCAQTECILSTGMKLHAEAGSSMELQTVADMSNQSSF